LIVPQWLQAVSPALRKVKHDPILRYTETRV
jgi:hypothetical protein